jgi:hypothetical protein
MRAMRGSLFLFLVLVLLVPASSLAKPDGSEKGAKAMLAAFLKPGADFAALTKPLRPTSADYKAIFDAESAAKAEKGFAQPWDEGSIVLKPKPEQSQLVLESATSDELKADSPKAKALPKHWTKIAASLKKGVRIYHLHFMEKGADKEDNAKQTSFAGLIFVNNHWVLMPKPWRVLESK